MVTMLINRGMATRAAMKWRRITWWDGTGPASNRLVAGLGEGHLRTAWAVGNRMPESAASPFPRHMFLAASLAAGRGFPRY